MSEGQEGSGNTRIVLSGRFRLVEAYVKEIAQVVVDLVISFIVGLRAVIEAVTAPLQAWVFKWGEEKRVWESKKIADETRLKEWEQRLSEREISLLGQYKEYQSGHGGGKEAAGHRTIHKTLGR